jgi:tripartite-type tricarboxylate transporter receptor subunit TctC
MKPCGLRLFNSALLGLLTGFVLLVPCMEVAAQAYPNRPIRLINGSAPGGPQDLIARTIGEAIAPALGQPVVVESRPGGAGGGSLAMNAVAAATPDGYTLGLGNSGVLGVAPVVQKMEWDPVKSFTPITLVAEGPLFLFASPALGATTVAEVVALAKANPRKFNYGSAGVGTSTHMGFELLKIRAGGIEVVHVPYNGADAMRRSILAGDTQLMIIPPSATLMSLVKEGKLKALAVMQPKRYAENPEVPSIQEAGFPNVEITGWQALLAPAGLPREIQARLNREFVAVLSRAEVQARILTTAQTVRTTTPEELSAFIAAVNRQWKEVVDKANIKVEN